MSSDDDDVFSMTPKQRYDRAIARKIVEIEARQRKCRKLAIRGRNRGWDVTPQFVNEHLPWFETWAQNLITAGQLINRLGIKRMSRSDYIEWSKTMNIPKAVMLDTVRTTAHNIPRATKYVGGYVSGSGVVPWMSTEWDLFPDSRHLRIYQDPGHNLDPRDWDALDIESGAFTSASAAQEHKKHVGAGIQWTCLYGTRTNIALTIDAIKALGGDYWDGHVCIWLADWNLDEEEAAALIGTYISGASCVAVQWASPTSNPNTVVPGGSYTLSQANIDISVVDAYWIPGVTFAIPTVPTPAPATKHGELITDDGHGGLTAREVSSSDGTDWH